MNDLVLRFEGFEPEEGLRRSAEAAVKALCARVPDARGQIVFSRLWLSLRAVVNIEVSPRRLEVTLEEDDAVIVARMLIRLRRFARLARWERQGVERPCGFCDCARFVYVPRVRQDTENAGGRPLQILFAASCGEMDALVCAECGHVEWFVSDPDELPVGAHGTTELHHRPGAPYR